MLSGKAPFSFLKLIVDVALGRCFSSRPLSVFEMCRCTDHLSKTDFLLLTVDSLGSSRRIRNSSCKYHSFFFLLCFFEWRWIILLRRQSCGWFDRIEWALTIPTIMMSPLSLSINIKTSISLYLEEFSEMDYQREPMLMIDRSINTAKSNSSPSTAKRAREMGGILNSLQHFLFLSYSPLFYSLL